MATATANVKNLTCAEYMEGKSRVRVSLSLFFSYCASHIITYVSLVYLVSNNSQSDRVHVCLVGCVSSAGFKKSNIVSMSATPVSSANGRHGESFPKSELVTLAALDVGSGATKMEVARMDTSQVPWSVVGEVLFSEQATLLLAGDLKAQSDNCLSEPIMNSAIDTLRNFKVRHRRLQI